MAVAMAEVTVVGVAVDVVGVVIRRGRNAGLRETGVTSSVFIARTMDTMQISVQRGRVMRCITLRLKMSNRLCYS